jgi:hypothetical protein
VVKEAVGEWAAELFVEEHEHEGDPGSFVGEPAGVAFAIAFRQPVRFHFAEIAAKLIQTVAIGGYAEGCEYCVVDVFGSPATHRSAAVQEGFHEADHAGVVDPDAGELRCSSGDGQSQTLQQGEVDVNVEAPGPKTREAVGYPEELCAYRLQLAEAFLKAEVREVVGADFIAQERGELLVLFDECVRNAFFQYARKM